jgi:hypothetical protein
VTVGAPTSALAHVSLTIFGSYGETTIDVGDVPSFGERSVQVPPGETYRVSATATMQTAPIQASITF